MDAHKINQTIELLPIVGELRKAGAYHVGPCPMCGGVDRFTVKHTSDGDRWHCRNCGDGKYHSVIDFIIARDHVSFVEACRILSNGDVSSIVKKTPQIQPVDTHTVLAPDQTTQVQMLSLMNVAAAALMQPDLAAQEYLYKRGLTPSTWEAWHIGSAMIYDTKAKRRRPAISLPWYYIDADGEFITAIKYRFIDSDPEGLRYTSMPGSVYVFYGTWSARPTDKTLLLVEGEINALSLWQQIPEDTTVLSIGSESGGRPEMLVNLARQYERVFVWCDDAARTLKYKAMIDKPTTGLQSPNIDGSKIDANALLQRGRLADFIKQIIGVDCQEY